MKRKQKKPPLYLHVRTPSANSIFARMNVFSLACLSKSIFTDALMQELGQDKGRNVSVTAKENSIRGTARSQKPAGIRRKESGNTS